MSERGGSPEHPKPAALRLNFRQKGGRGGLYADQSGDSAIGPIRFLLCHCLTKR